MVTRLSYRCCWSAPHPAVGTRGRCDSLLLASRAGHYHAMRVLLLLVPEGSKGGKDAKDEDGWTALHFAAQGGRVDMLRELLVMGAGADAVNHEGKTPLHLACEGGHVECVRQLLCRGATPSLADASGHTPLYFANSGGNLACVRALMAYGAGWDIVA
mmetsp:Transcript_42074/g.82310  ORF Transcript_42074/g.82310 Transcript_42074/m.82310 type:complete len:158 (+) Transcript_42074:994-1467(+)